MIRAMTASVRRMLCLIPCALLVTGGLARRGSAKEHDAACPELPSLVERMRNTLLLASVHRARGSSIGAYQVMRVNATQVLREVKGDRCGVLPRYFERALARAAHASSAADAALELDLGYASAIALAMAGRLPPDTVTVKTLDVPESAQYGENCPDLFALVQRLDVPAAQVGARATQVLADLKAHPRCPRVREAIEAEGEQLVAAVDAVVLDEAPASPSAGNPVARCPELPVVIDRLTATVNVGAPLYNRGDREGCRRLYEKAARALKDELIPGGRCPVVRRELASALDEAAQAETPDSAAWALRRGFDRITNAVRPPAAVTQ